MSTPRLPEHLPSRKDDSLMKECQAFLKMTYSGWMAVTTQKNIPSSRRPHGAKGSTGQCPHIVLLEATQGVGFGPLDPGAFDEGTTRLVAGTEPLDRRETNIIIGPQFLSLSSRDQFTTMSQP